jgi:membrane protein YqaA with SNARE-associated domain
MNFEQMLSHYGVYLTTIVISLIAGFVPIDIMEVYLVWVAALTPRSQGLPIVALATLGQMTGKTVLYLAASGALKISVRKPNARLQAVREKIANWRYGISLLVLLSASVGVPPFYWVTIAAGAGRLKLPYYLAAGSAGRFARFGLCVFFPYLIKGLLH